MTVEAPRPLRIRLTELPESGDEAGGGGDASPVVRHLRHTPPFGEAPLGQRS
jgi:hypothetical protein